MKAYLIDAINEMVIQIDYKGYEHKCELMKCNMVQVLSIGGKNDLWIDEEGMLKEYNHFFKWEDKEGEMYCHTVGGNAIILGVDEEGECVEPFNLTLEEVQSKVTFIGKRYIDHSKLKIEVEEWKI